MICSRPWPISAEIMSRAWRLASVCSMFNWAERKPPAEGQARLINLLITALRIVVAQSVNIADARRLALRFYAVLLTDVLHGLRDKAAIATTDNAIPQLPPSWPLASLAATIDPCVVSPIIVVCVRGNKPPPVVDPIIVQRGPTPWFPQGWCDAFHVLCSKGQEPRDNSRGANSSTSGKTLAELMDICDSINGIELDLCSANYAMNKNGGELQTCKQRANDRMFACYSSAKSLTGNGAHVAP